MIITLRNIVIFKDRIGEDFVNSYLHGESLNYVMLSSFFNIIIIIFFSDEW